MEMVEAVTVTFDPRALQVTRKVDILTPLGALYYNTGRYEEALQVYKEAAALQPDSTDIWLALVRGHTNALTHTQGTVSLLLLLFMFLLIKQQQCLAHLLLLCLEVAHNRSISHSLRIERLYKPLML